MAQKTPTSSLLAPLQPHDPLLQIYARLEGHLIPSPISSPFLSLEEALLECIQHLNSEHEAGLVADPALYEVYAARKSGKRNRDLPAFDLAQTVGQTGNRSFYLQLKGEQKMQKKVSSIKSIETEISMGSRKQSENCESNSFFGCFCLGKGK